MVQGTPNPTPLSHCPISLLIWTHYGYYYYLFTITTFYILLLLLLLFYIVNFWRNYNIGLSNLPYVRNWSLKFQVSTISPSSLKK